MLVVLVVLAVIASAVVPMFHSSQSNRLGWAATQLQSDITFARAESFVRSEAPRVVAINAMGTGYFIATVVAPDTAVTHPTTGLPHVVTFGQGDFRGFAGVSVQSYSLAGDAVLGFGAYGQLDQSTDATVTLAIESLTTTLTIDSATGNVTVN